MQANQKSLPKTSIFCEDSESSSKSQTSAVKRQRKNYYVKKEPVWTKEEDQKLLLLVDLHGVQKFRLIAQELNKTLLKTHQRYYKLIGENKYDNNRKWTPEEDAILTRIIQRDGSSKWQNVAEHLPGRLPKQCRERWLYRINPSIVKD